MKPPDKYSIIWIVLFISLLIIGFLCFRNSKGEAKEYVSLNRCFVYAPKMPYFPDIQVLGIEVDEQLYRIIECESNFQPDVCNIKYGCSSGIGLGQLTTGAIKDCEKGLEKIIDPYNEQDNLDCCIWLYEKYGTAPWGCENCEWGSYSCWQTI